MGRAVYPPPGTIKSTQRGTSTIATGSNSTSVTLSPAVNPAKTQVRLLGYTSNLGSSESANDKPYLSLASGSSLTINRANGGGGSPVITVSWEITEVY